MLYGKGYSNVLKPFMITISRHTCIQLFQLCASHRSRESSLEKRFFSERNHYYECGQLKTFEYISKNQVLYCTERSCLEKGSLRI